MDDLIDLRLTKYESLAFLALIFHGSNDASSLSEIFQVPFGRIYDVLNMLEVKGQVETEEILFY